MKRSGCRFGLEVEVLAPGGVGAANHAHDMAGGVEGEGPGLALELHVGEFVQELVAFAAVAVVAAGYEVFPGGEAAAGAGDDVVEGELAGGEDDVAVLAGVAVAQEDVLAGECAGLVGDSAVFEEADDAGHGYVHASGVEDGSLLFFGARDAFEHQHEGAAGTADVDGLVRCIEDEDGGLERRLAKDSGANVGFDHDAPRAMPAGVTDVPLVA